MSKYDVFSNFSLVPTVETQNVHYFFVSQVIQLNFGTETQIQILIPIFDSKDGPCNDYEQADTKTVMLVHFLAKHLLEIASPWQQIRS